MPKTLQELEQQARRRKGLSADQPFDFGGTRGIIEAAIPAGTERQAAFTRFGVGGGSVLPSPSPTPGGFDLNQVIGQYFPSGGFATSTDLSTFPSFISDVITYVLTSLTFILYYIKFSLIVK